MVGLGTGGGGGGNDGQVSLYERMRVRQRMNLIEQTAPSFAAKNPDYAVELASTPTDDYDLVQGVMGAIGQTGLDETIRQLQSTEDDYQRAWFSSMHPQQQAALQAQGYSPPGDRGGGGLLGEFTSILELPGTTWAKSAVQAVTPFTRTTGGNLRIGAWDGPLGPIGDAAAIAGMGIGTIPRGLKMGLGAVFKGMEGAWQLQTRVYRTGMDMAERSRFENTGEYGESTGEGLLTKFLSPIPGAGSLIEGVAYGAMNPTQILKSWHEVDDGEEYATREHRARARAVLEDAQKDGEFRDEDLAELMKIAAMRQAGHTLGEVAEELGYEDGSDDWNRSVERINMLDAQPDMLEAREILANGRVSWGREQARSMGIAEGTFLYNMVSGTNDAAFMMVADPTNLVGGGIVKARRAFGIAARAGDTKTIVQAGKVGRYAEAVRLAKNGRNAEAKLLLKRAGYEGTIEQASRELFVNQGPFVDKLFRNRYVWKEADGVNRWMNTVSSYFKQLEDTKRLAARATTTEDEAIDAWRELDMAQEAIINKQAPQAMQAFDTLTEYHKTMVDTPGEMGLDTFEGMWRFFESPTGHAAVDATPLGGFQAKYRPLPRIDRKQRIANYSKAWFAEKFDPSGGFVGKGIAAMEAEWAKVGKAVHDAEGNVLKWVPGEFDELNNYVDKTPNKPLRNFVRSMFYHVPHSTIIHVDRPEAIEEFRRLTEMGALAHMPKPLRDEMVGRFARGTDNDRHLLIEGLVADVFGRSGLINELDSAGQTLLRRFVTKTRQGYSIGDADQIVAHAGRSRAGILPDVAANTEFSTMFAMPNFKELAHATRKMNRHRILFNRVNPNEVDAFVTKVWAPAQLLRPGFILRASGETLIHFMLRRSPGEYARTKAALRSLGLQKTRGGKLAMTDVDAYARFLGLADENGKALPAVARDFKEFHEFTAMRPMLWFTHQLGEWSGLLGEVAEADILARAAKRAMEGGKQHFDDLTPELQRPFLEAARQELHDTKKIRSKIVDTYDWAEKLALRIGGGMHQLGANKGWMSKTDIYEAFGRLGNDIDSSTPLGARFANEHDVGVHVGHLMLTDDVIARAILEQQGGLFDPYTNMSGKVIGGMLDENMQHVVGGETKARYIQTKIDPSNITYYGRTDASEWYDALASIYERTAASPTAMAFVEEYQHYVAPTQVNGLQQFFAGLGINNETVRRLANSDDGGIEGLRQLRKMLDDSGVIGPLRDYIRDPTPAKERIVQRVVKSVKRKVDTEVVKRTDVKQELIELVDEVVDAELTEEIVRQRRVMRSGGRTYEVNRLDLAEDSSGINVEGFDPAGVVPTATTPDQFHGVGYHVSMDAATLKDKGPRAGIGDLGEHVPMALDRRSAEYVRTVQRKAARLGAVDAKPKTNQAIIKETLSSMGVDTTRMRPRSKVKVTPKLRQHMQSIGVTHDEVAHQIDDARDYWAQMLDEVAMWKDESLNRLIGYGDEADANFIGWVHIDPAQRGGEWDFLEQLTRDEQRILFDQDYIKIYDPEETSLSLDQVNGISEGIGTEKLSAAGYDSADDWLRDVMIVNSPAHAIRETEAAKLLDVQYGVDMTSVSSAPVLAAEMAASRGFSDEITDTYREVQQITQETLDGVRAQITLADHPDLWERMQDVDLKDWDDLARDINRVIDPATLPLAPAHELRRRAVLQVHERFADEIHPKVLTRDSGIWDITDPKAIDIVPMRIREGATAQWDPNLHGLSVQNRDAFVTGKEEITRTATRIDPGDRAGLERFVEGAPLADDEEFVTVSKVIEDDVEVREIVDALVHNTRKLDPRTLELLLSRQLKDRRLSMSLDSVLDAGRKAGRRELLDSVNAEQLRSIALVSAPVGYKPAIPLERGMTRLYMPAFDRGQAALVHRLQQGNLQDETLQVWVEVLNEEMTRLGERLKIEPRNLTQHFGSQRGTLLNNLADTERARAGEDFMPWGFAHTDPDIAREVGEAMDRAMTNFEQITGHNLDELAGQMGVASPVSRGTTTARQRMTILDVPDQQMTDANVGRFYWGAIDEEALNANQWKARHQGITAVGNEGFYQVDPVRQVKAKTLDPNSSQWMYRVKVTTAEGSEHTQVVGREGLSELENNPDIAGVEKLSEFYGSGQTEDLAISELVSAQEDELLKRLSTIRNGEVAHDEMFSELIGPMLRGEDITDVKLRTLTPEDDLPAHAFGPTILDPRPLGIGNIIDVFRGASNHGFQDVITPAINAIMYHPQMHHAMVESFKHQYPLWLASEGVQSIRKSGAALTQMPDTDGPWGNIFNAMDFDDDWVKGFHRFLEHDLPSHTDGKVVAVAAKGADAGTVQPILDPTQEITEIVKRAQDLMDAFAPGSEVSGTEFMARWLDYITDGRKVDTVYEVQDELTETRKLAKRLEDSIKKDRALLKMNTEAASGTDRNIGMLRGLRKKIRDAQAELDGAKLRLQSAGDVKVMDAAGELAEMDKWARDMPYSEWDDDRLQTGLDRVTALIGETDTTRVENELSAIVGGLPRDWRHSGSHMSLENIRRDFAETIEFKARRRKLEAIVPDRYWDDPTTIYSKESAGQAWRSMIDNDPFFRDEMERSGRELRKQLRHANVDYAEMRQNMIQGAFTRFTPFIDDHRVRSQFQGHVGGLIPFWFAEEQFMKRWIKGVYETPHSLRKGQMTMNGLRNMGFIDTDEYGNDVFVYPGSEMLVEAIAPITPFLFGGTGLGEITTGPLSTNVQYMFPGLNDSPGRFAYGPWAAVQMNFIANRFPEFSDVRDELLGDMSANRWDPGTSGSNAVLDSFMPSSVGRLVRAAFRKGDDTQLASATMQAMSVMAASGNMPDPSAPAEELEDFIHEATSMARTILGLRAFTSFFGGSTGNVELEGIEMRKEFRELLEAGLPYPDAVQALSDKYKGTDQMVSPWTVFGTESTSGAPIPATASALGYMEQNRSFISAFPDLAPWFLPQEQAGDFGVKERRARNTALADELRIRRSPREFLRSLYVAEAAETFFDTDDSYQTMLMGLSGNRPLREVIQEEYRAWKSSYLTMHPVFAEEISTREGQARRERLVDQARLVLADRQNVPDSPHSFLLLEFLDAIVDYQDQIDALKYINSDDATQLRRTLRLQFYNLARGAVTEAPELSAFFNSVVRPMIGSTELSQIEAGIYGLTA